VPEVRTQQELAQLLRQTGAFSDRDMGRAIQEIEERTMGKHIGVGVKAVLMAIATAKQDDDMAGSFAEIISDQIVTNAQPINDGGPESYT
jgi:vesicle-fusing ATPase